MELSRVERDIRRVPGVLACQVTGGEVVVLAAPDADADVVTAGVQAVLTQAASSPPVRVIGGRAAIVPLRSRRTGRRAIAAVSAGAAALAAAGVAAAVNGAFSPAGPQRPSIAEQQVAAPPTTAGAEPDASTGGRTRASTTTRTTVPRPASDVQSERQLATLGAGPQLLAFPIPLPGQAAAPPRRGSPEPKAKDVAVAAPPPVTPPPPTTAPSTTTPPTTTPPTTTAPPLIAATPTTAFYDEHDNDGGERGEDSNGHSTTGPQGDGSGRDESARGRRD